MNAHSIMSDDITNRRDVNPLFKEWGNRCKPELKTRLYDAVKTRIKATNDLIVGVIEKDLYIIGVSTSSTDGYQTYFIPQHVIDATNKAIDDQIRDWKGLRYWRFSKESLDNITWSKWFKKAKCWQDQNQHKPLGTFWCLVLDSLKQHTKTIAGMVYHGRQQIALSDCLFSKCVLKILKNSVRFERTRETPLLPVRVLTQSKDIQKKLNQIDSGYQISKWKQEYDIKYKQQKKYSNSTGNKSRANLATLINQKCGDHAKKVYHRNIQSLQTIIPDLKINFSAIQTDDNSDNIINSYQSSYSNTNNNNNDNNSLMPQYGSSNGYPGVIASMPKQQISNINNNNNKNNNNNNNNNVLMPPPVGIPTDDSLSSISSDGSTLSYQSRQSRNSNNNNNNNHRYGPTRGMSHHLRTERSRNSPMTRNTYSAAMSPNEKIRQLEMENDRYKHELANMKKLFNQKMQSMNMMNYPMNMMNPMMWMMMNPMMSMMNNPNNIPTPMSVPTPPHSFNLTDNNGNTALYNGGPEMMLNINPNNRQQFMNGSNNPNTPNTPNTPNASSTSNNNTPNINNININNDFNDNPHPQTVIQVPVALQTIYVITG